MLLAQFIILVCKNMRGVLNNIGGEEATASSCGEASSLPATAEFQSINTA
jgi:hypothetical protein